MTRFLRKNDDHLDTAPAAEPGPDAGFRERVLRTAVERALNAQQPVVIARLAKARRKNPDATPAEVIESLGRSYQIAVTAVGAVGGGIAIIPAIGTVASLATATAEAIAALDAAVLYTLAVAEVHRLPMDDLERRRTLVLGIVVGEGGTALMRKVTGGKDRWARSVTDALPLRVLGPLNNTLTQWFVKRYVTRQVALAVGRALPLGAGLIIGGVGNLLIARAVIRSGEKAFGPAPEEWPDGSVPPAAA